MAADHNLKGSIARSISSNWAALGVGVVIAFLLSPFVVGKLGTVGYGIWALALQFTAYLHLFDFGVRESVIRYTAKYVARGQDRRLAHVLATAVSIYVPIAIVTAGIAAAAAWYLPVLFKVPADLVEATRWTVLSVGLSVALSFVCNVFTGVLQGLQRFDVANAFGVGAAILRAVGTWALLANGYGLAAIGAIQLATAALWGVGTAFAAVHMLRRVGMRFVLERPPARVRRAARAKILGFGFYVLVNNLAQKVNYSSDAIIIAWFLPLNAVSYYAVAGGLIDNLRNLVSSTAQVFSPETSRLFARREHEQLQALVVAAGKFVLLLALPVALSFVFLGEGFIRIWMGPELAMPAGQVLLVLGIAQILAAPTFALSAVLYGVSRPRTIAGLRIGEAIGKIGLSIVLVQKLGIVGVALGSLVPGALLGLFIVPAIACRRIGMDLGQFLIGTYGRTAPGAVVFGALAWAVSRYWPPESLTTFFLKVGFLVGIYLIATYAMALTAAERAMLRASVRAGRPARG